MTAKLVALFSVLQAIEGHCAGVVCAGCHPKETASFASSAMGRSIGPPANTVPGGRVTHRETGSVLNIDWKSGQMVHHLTELGLRADYTIDYQIGAGKVGYSYIAKAGDYLLQSPVSYYRDYGWDVSPGFKEATVLDFDRVLGDQCLFCHSGSSQFLGKRRLLAGAKVEPIDCERCHGNTQQHVEHPSRVNIVNPARLAARDRDSVCEQCHLEGAARVLNPGKRWQDFNAGEELEATFSVYVDDERRPAAKVVSHVEQLGLSRCATESRGKLWCGTCHDPHGPGSGNRAIEMKAVCSGCHPTISSSNHAQDISDCVHCHMPRLNPKDIAHAASTDHRILARPVKAPEASVSTSIRVWHEPAAEIRQRNLGLAETQLSGSRGLRSLQEGGRLLKELPADQRENDAMVLSALGDVALSEGRTKDSQFLFGKAAQLAPDNGEYLMFLGISLKRKGDFADAEKALRKAIAVDASLQRAYLELSAMYSRQGKGKEMADILSEYLKWNPQSILIRSTLEGLR
jgi:predicted CXXCH cytochrome family protein